MSDNRKSGQVPGSRTPPPDKGSPHSPPPRDLRRDLDWTGKGDLNRQEKAQDEHPRPPEPGQNDGGRRRMGIFLVIFIGIILVASAFTSVSIANSPMAIGSILAAAVLGLLYSRGLRIGRGQFGRYLGLWGLVILGLTSVYYIAGEPNLGGRSFQRDLQAGKVTVSEAGEVVIPRAADGHYWMYVSINGKDIPMMVDTGASSLVLARRDAERAGINTDRLTFSGISSTANGEARHAVTRIDEMRLGLVVARQFPVSVMEDPEGLNTSLFGMNALEIFSSFEFRDGKLILRP